MEQEYKIIVQPGTSNVENLRTAKEGTDMHKYYHDVILADASGSHYVSNLEEALKRVAAEEKTVLFDSELAIFGNKDYVALDIADGFKGSIGWGFKKGSELTDFFDYHLFRMGQTGVMPKIYRVGILKLNTLSIYEKHEIIQQIQVVRIFPCLTHKRKLLTPEARMIEWITEDNYYCPKLLCFP